MSGHARRGGSRIEVMFPPAAIGISHSDGAYSRGCVTSRRIPMSNVYGATPSELAQYGNLNLWQSLVLLQKWSPLLNFVRAFLAEPDPYKRSLIVGDAADWLASQTQTKSDDEFIRLITDVVKTPQGEALLRRIVAYAEALR